MPSSSINSFPRSSGYPSAQAPSPSGAYPSNGPPPPPPPPGSQQQQRGQQSPYPSSQHPRTPGGGQTGSSQGFPLSGGGLAGAQQQQQQQQGRAGNGSFPFGGGLQQGSNQSSSSGAQNASQHQQNLLSMMAGGNGTPQLGNSQPQQPPTPQHQQQQGPPSATPSHQSLFSGGSHGLPPHLAGGSDQASDADFPALGNTPGGNASLAALNAQSYAAQASALQAAQQQAGGHPQAVGNGAFSADDFPALGGDGSMLNGAVGGGSMMGGLAGQVHQHQQQQQMQQQMQQLQQQQHQQQHQQQQQIGQGGKASRGLQEDIRMSNSAQSAWPTQTQSSGSANALAPPPGQQSRPPPNGTPLQSHPSPQAPSDLVPPPQQQQGPQTQSTEGPFPTQTVPAEQVLASPADKWGLAAFLHAIRNADEDRGMLAFGTDLMTLGMNMGGVDPLSNSLVAPWADPALTRGVHLEEEYHTPSCYNVRPAAAQTKMNLFAEETLFFIFYACPRDALQEFAAQELYARHWRWHKEIGYWLTKDPRAEATEKTATYERGTYIFFDPATWSRVEQKDFTLAYEFLEDRSQQQQQAQQAAAAAAQAQQQVQQQQQQAPGNPAGVSGGNAARAFNQQAVM